ncbi:MAG: hypothetical protein M3Z06_09775, partial [Actinomycetota bacterium]|nr:hypothetical protein [Actinomycetota bacterium]
MSTSRPFQNEPVLELRRAPVRAELADALQRVDRQLPLEVPVMAGAADRRPAGDALASTDPGEPGRLVARSAGASAQDVQA